MIEVAGKGIALGLLLSVLVGPVFFMLIDTAISGGIKKALVMDTGILLSDAIFISLFVFGAAKYMKPLIESPYISLIGGAVFIGFGASSFIGYGKNTGIATGFKTNFVKGFFINTMNPSVVLFWLTSVAVVVSRYSHDGAGVFIFFLSVIATTFSTDIIKILLASKIKKFITNTHIHYFRVLTGIVMGAFGIYLIGSTLLSNKI